MSISLTTPEEIIDPFKSLMKELSKAKLHLSNNEQHRRSKRLSLLIKQPINNTRNLSLIVSFLKQYPFFIQFIVFNEIDDNTLEKMANYVDIKYIKKGQFIYKEGEKLDFFYILIKGKIAFKRIVKKKNNDHSYSLIEEEKLITESGYPFNERNFLLKEKRTNSCYTQDDCILLYIDEEMFKLTIMKPLVKNENDKKTFLLRSLINIPGLNHQLYEGLYSNITPRVVRSNEFLIKENEIGNTIFIVFQNELIVSKYIVTRDKYINHPLCKVSKGAILGLELLFGKKCYSYSFRGNPQREEIAFVFEFDLSRINEEIKLKLREVHAQFYVRFKDGMDKLYIQKLKHEKTNSISYPNISLDLFSNEELFNRKIENSYNKIIEEQRKKEQAIKKGKVMPSKVAIYSLPKLIHKNLFVKTTKSSNSDLFSAYNRFTKKHHQLTKQNQQSICSSSIIHSKSFNTFSIKTLMTKTNINTNGGMGLLNKNHSIINKKQSKGEYSNNHSCISVIVSPQMKSTMFDYAKVTLNIKHKFNSGIFTIPLVTGGL